MARAEPLGGAHAGGFLLGAVEQDVHPRLVIARVSSAPNRSSAVVSVSSDIRSLRQASRTRRSALARSPRADHHLRQREPALGRDRRFVLEPRPHRGVVATVVPQRGLDAPAQEGLRRPARIGRKEGAIALDRSAVVVAAQDQPFGEFARHRIRDRGLRLRRVGRLALAHELDDVFQRVLVGLRGRRRRGDRRRRRRVCAPAGRAACWRVAGASAGGGRCGAGSGRCGERGCAAAVGAVAGVVAGVVLGTTLRAIGRGFGNGTFGLAQASTDNGGQADRQRQTCRQCGRSQCGCAGGTGHGFPLRRRIIQSLKP